MARPPVEGVKYFPKDIAFYQDDKVRILRGQFGAKGMYLLDYLLCEVYGKCGYYMTWNDSKCFLVSDGAGCGCSSGFVREFIASCLQCGFFDETVFNAWGILTSAGIQRRYIRMFNGRDAIYLQDEYLLLDKSSKKDFPAGILLKCAFLNFGTIENPEKSTENPEKSTENRQSKINKINNSLSLARASKSVYGKHENVLLYPEEYAELRRQIGESTDDRIDHFSEKLESRGYRFDSHYKAILDWWREDSQRAPATPSKKACKSNNISMGSFDTDAFFEAAIRRTFEEAVL